MTVSREQTQAKLDLLASGVTRHVPEQTYLVPDRFEQLARQYPDKTFLYYNGQEISFFELNLRANQYAHVAATLGIKSGDVGAVMIENRPEFFYAWLGVGDGRSAVLGMTPIVLRRRFSASQFWNDVRQHDVTTVQYIGEICRYLINQPALGTDKQHSLLRMTGAGMTAGVWHKFIERFGDIEIYEGWGSTEANCSTMNVDGEVGSCGRIPFKERSNARLVKYDLENDCHVNNEQGFLQECEPACWLYA